MSIAVAIVEDDRALREGLASLIAGEPDLRSAGQYDSVEAALADRALRPDVVLLDIHLPGILGSEGVARIVERHPSSVVLMLTIYDGQDKVFESICNGASGYLLKKTPPVRLLAAIREAHAGGSPMSPEIARQVIGLFRGLRPAPPPAHALTPQEVRLLALLADGYSYLNAAGQLDISINTVRNHVRSIYDKLHVHTKSEAVSKAMKQGILR
jgi:DNA-binding NarL/FixJ family response regulator